MPEAFAGFWLSLSCSLCASGCSSSIRRSRRTSCPANSRPRTLCGSWSSSAALRFQKTSHIGSASSNCILMHISTSRFTVCFGLFRISYPNNNITAISSSDQQGPWQAETPNSIICHSTLFCLKKFQSVHASGSPKFAARCRITRMLFPFSKFTNFGQSWITKLSAPLIKTSLLRAQ